MLTRHAYLEKDVALGNSGTRTIDIKTRHPITALWLEMKCNNGTSWNHNSPMHLCVSSIEIIDGSTVLFSLDGPELLGKVCAELGFMPQQRFNDIAGDPQSLALPIMFGRFLGDPLYALDPRRLANPQVRVTWNLATVNAVAVTGYADGGLTMTLIAEVMEGAPTPAGFLSSKEVYTYTTATGTEYIDLPTDGAYVGLLLRFVATTSHWFSVVSNIKLSIDGDEKVPIDLVGEDMQYLLMLRQPPLHYRHLFHIKDSDTLYPILKELEGVQLISEDTQDIVYMYSNYEYGQRPVYLQQAGSAYGSYVNSGGNVRGYCPFHCVYWPFGDLQEPAEWFQVGRNQSIRLELTGGIASKAAYVCLVQERRY